MNSSFYNVIVDTLRVMKISIFSILFVSLSLSADPFGKYEKELDDWKSSHSNITAKFSSEENTIMALFRSGKFSPSESSDLVDSMEDLPKYLKFSSIVSSKIVHEKGIQIKKYTVKKSDTLSSIAKGYRTTIPQIKEQNGLKTDLIRLGDILEIPVVTGNAYKKKIVTQRLFINPVPGSRITSYFGNRKDPFNKFSKNFHSGMDLGAPIGSPVVASADGEVVFTGKNGGYGNTVMILHSGGNKTVYAHCSKIVVEVGEKVKMGRVIAAVGRTGTATGAHLHFEVHKNGKITNPHRALATYEKLVTNLPQTNSE